MAQMALRIAALGCVLTLWEASTLAQSTRSNSKQANSRSCRKSGVTEGTLRPVNRHSESLATSVSSGSGTLPNKMAKSGESMTFPSSQLGCKTRNTRSNLLWIGY